MERQRSAAFPFYFDPREAEDLLEFFANYLTLDDVDEQTGQNLPFRLMRWLQFCFGSILGWKRVADRRLRFVEAYLETAKGSTKTPGAAGFGLYRLVGENRTNVEIYSLGVNGDQANYLYGFAKRMAERSEDLRDLLDIGEYNAAWIVRNSFFRPLTSEGKSLDNKRVFLALIDELHEHPSDVIPEKMRLGIKTQVDGLVLMITNAGFDKTSVCWTKHDYGIKVLEGAIVDEEYFAYICQLDPCERCRTEGKTQPDDGCATCDHWTDERVWPKVNPALPELPQLEHYMRGVVKKALNEPSSLARIKRLNFCIWTQGHSIWIPSDQWAACVSVVERPKSGVPCAAAFDMSQKIDLTACCVAQRFDDADTAAETIELEENENGQTVKKLWSVNYRIRLTGFAWIPQDTLLERVKNEHIPYDVWLRNGHIRATPGPVIDHHLIADQFHEEIGSVYKPQILGYDPYNATEFAVGLRDRRKYTIAEIGQGRRLSEYVKLFYALVRLKRIEHDGNPVFAWCVSNAEPKADRYENVWLEKSAGGKRIDLAIAAVMAVSRVVLLPRPSRRRLEAKQWTPQGWVNPGGSPEGAPA